ncbi:flavin-containing monooxygenase [Dactylonectria estremocensis]|uniref:Flavin-containing monooxygenase n=1 Tax=Dactylonectria estremocensis TaxID=1079267 RepID=A0A9P9ETL0_9HYPO|nr:flavin-containing monooxygenase [Dactylonectria estremocensis]
MQALAFPLASLPADVFTTPIPNTIDHVQVAKECVARLAANDVSVFASGPAHWRDLLAMTSTLRTFTSGPAAGAAWKDTTSLHKPTGFRLEQGSAHVVNRGPLSFIDARFSYTNGLQPRGRCLGLVKMAPEALPGKQEVEYKIWALTTMLESVDGYGDPDVFPPHLIGKETSHHRHGGIINGDKEPYFDALVVGLGPSGLATLARLRALNLNAIACDKISQVGMNWTDRYQSLRLHTPKVQNSLPFNFKPPQDAPYYLRKDDLERYYRSFVDHYGLASSLWLSTTMEHARFNNATSSWTVVLTQSGQQSTVTAKHVVFCLGTTGRLPRSPSFPGRDEFSGEVLHAVDYISAAEWAGKRGVVIGTANTGHDIAEDMANVGMHVTMVQRSRTPVLNVERLPLHQAFHESVDVTEVDKWFFTSPLAIERVLMREVARQMVLQDKDKLDKLEEKGFSVYREADLTQILFERAGRHYMDVGVSQMIIDGKIKVKSGSLVASFTSHGLGFTDGTEIPADVVVFATGYESDMKLAVSKLLDPEVADKLDECWLLDEEGNPRGSWKPIGHPNIWYCPGDIGTSRFFSRFLALQIKADVEETPFVPYDRRQ